MISGQNSTIFALKIRPSSPGLQHTSTSGIHTQIIASHLISHHIQRRCRKKKERVCVQGVKLGEMSTMRKAVALLACSYALPTTAMRKLGATYKVGHQPSSIFKDRQVALPHHHPLSVFKSLLWRGNRLTKPSTCHHRLMEESTCGRGICRGENHHPRSPPFT